MAIDVDTIATDADLSNEVGGATKLANVIPADWSGSAKPARTAALEEILLTLSRRTPPIQEADLQIPAELKTAVVLGALERLYRRAMLESGDHFDAQRRIYERRYSAELLNVTPTVSDGGRATTFGIAIHRR